MRVMRGCLCLCVFVYLYLCWCVCVVCVFVFVCVFVCVFVFVYLFVYFVQMISLIFLFVAFLEDEFVFKLSLDIYLFLRCSDLQVLNLFLLLFHATNFYSRRLDYLHALLQIR